jgi:alpha-galactosidase
VECHDFKQEDIVKRFATWFGVLALFGITANVAAGGSIVFASGDTEVRVEAAKDLLQVASLKCVPTGLDWIAGAAENASIPLIAFIEIEGRQVPVRWRFTGIEKSSTPNSHVLCFRCDEPPLELRSIWHAHSGPGPVEHVIEITNQTGKTILLPLQPTLAFSTRAGSKGGLEEWWVERGGSRPSDFGTHREPIGPSFKSSLVSTPHGGPIPWWSIQDRQKRGGWYAGIEFSGFVRMALQTGKNGTEPVGPLRAVFGLGKSDSEDAAYRTRLAAGETFTTPTVFVGCYAGEVDDGANRLRRWVESHLRPSSSANLPLLVSNSWGSGMIIDEALAHRMIDTAAGLGMEMFHVDAGWYRHVGDWRTDPIKFPAGMTGLARYTHDKGLLFGLWIAWTQGGDRLDPARPGAVFSVQDPMMKPWFPTDYPTTWKCSDFTGATVCLGEPKAVEWCLRDMRRAVPEFKLDLLEHDQRQIVDSCNRPGHRHTGSPIDVAYHAALGYYQVQDGLRKDIPNLLFEDCCDGGNIVDYGIVRRTHYISITDTYDPLSNRRAFYDSSYALPPAMCECYVENRPGKTPANFLYMLRSGLMGWCTMMTDLSSWTPEQKAASKRQFEIYKQSLRPLIQHANLYHISQRPDGRRWDGMQYYNPADGRGVLFAFRGTTNQRSHQFRLKGLEPDARYRLTCEDASSPPCTMIGRQLLDTGLIVDLAEPESSEMVHMVRMPR